MEPLRRLVIVGRGREPPAVDLQDPIPGPQAGSLSRQAGRHGRHREELAVEDETDPPARVVDLLDPLEDQKTHDARHESRGQRDAGPSVDAQRDVLDLSRREL